jgi:hypothetical protein
VTDENLGHLWDFVEDEWRWRAIVAKVDEKPRAAGIDPADRDLTPEGLDARGQGASGARALGGVP